MNNERMAPVKTSERYVILDALRGFAILGICTANYPEFSLYTFQSKEITDAMPTAGIDRVLRFMLYFLVDGKFYTLFSLLFGIGFSIIISNAARKGANGFRIFYRRMGSRSITLRSLTWCGTVVCCPLTAPFPRRSAQPPTISQVVRSSTSTPQSPLWSSC